MLLALAFFLSILGCAKDNSDAAHDSGIDAASDTDTDTDSDIDSDSDTDTDTEGDASVDSGFESVVLTVDTSGVLNAPASITVPSVGIHVLPRGSTESLLADEHHVGCAAPWGDFDVLFEDDFENGTGLWTVSTGWNVSHNKYDSPSSSIEAGMFSGELTSQPMDTSGYSRMVVTFKYFPDGTNVYDDIRIFYFNALTGDYDEIEELGSHHPGYYSWQTYFHTFEKDAENEGYFSSEFKIKIVPHINQFLQTFSVDDVVIQGSNTPFVPEAPAAVLFEDDFEGNFTRWESHGDWLVSSDLFESGSQSAKASGSAGDIVSNPIEADCAFCTRMHISFRYYLDGEIGQGEVGIGPTVAYFNGTSFEKIRGVDEKVLISLGKEKRWHTYTSVLYNVLNYKRFFNDGFKVKITAPELVDDESLYIEDVRIESYQDAAIFKYWDIKGLEENSSSVDVLMDDDVLATATYLPKILPGTCVDADVPTGPVGGGYGYDRVLDLPTDSVDFYIDIDEEDPRTALLNVLEDAAFVEPGDDGIIYIYLHDDLEVDLTGEDNLVVPANVTLASGRGRAPGIAGALIHKDDCTGAAPLFEVIDENTRITGLRLQGPGAYWDPYYDPQSTNYMLTSGSRGVLFQNSGELDNCELYNWSYSAIRIDAAKKQQQIHHNYIHDCSGPLGYGLEIFVGDPVIESNVFGGLRHAIAATGTEIECNYEAAYNLVVYGEPVNESRQLEGSNGAKGMSHAFDMHGGHDADQLNNDAGGWISIHHNTFANVGGKAIYIRGEPRISSEIYDNWFLQETMRGAVAQRTSYLNVNYSVFNNQIGIVRHFVER
ncbi:MAG: hypothetical protein GY854_34865 [Deltaproteobacteria bacterium]|nr:hypothetical protein [Deltaproteobacteria bacterium]